MIACLLIKEIPQGVNNLKDNLKKKGFKIIISTKILIFKKSSLNIMFLIKGILIEPVSRVSLSNRMEVEDQLHCILRRSKNMLMLLLIENELLIRLKYLIDQMMSS